MVRTQLTRERHRQVRERTALDALIDTALVGHVGLTDEGGHPVVLPTAIARDGDRVLLHGSTGSRWMRRVATGVPIALSIAVLDGVVVARSAFNSSLRYRSAVVFGSCQVLEGAAKARGLDVLVDALIPGRRAEVRASSPAELRRTMVLALPLVTWSVKVAGAWPEDDEADLAGDAWAGVVPLSRAPTGVLPAPDLRPGIAVPASVRALAGETPGQ